jgi:uncharacterized protein with FMN-binding domain
MEQSKSKQFITTVIVLTAIFIAVGVIVIKKKRPASSASPLSDTSNSTVNATPASSVSSYKDGTYSAEGNYYTPESNETINVSVTLKDGVITDTSAGGIVHNRDSRMYQMMFLNNYKVYVVGKKIDNVRLSRVSGSSLTSQGFNSAIDQIKRQALS